MSLSVPESIMTSEELAKIGGFDRTIADHLDEALVSGGSSDDYSVSVKERSYNAQGDWNPITSTGTDDRAAFIAAIAAATLTNAKTVVLPPGNYRLSKYVNINGARDLRIVGSAGSTIYYNSDDQAVVTDGTAASSNEARSAFLLTYCTNVTFENITFVGGDFYVSQINLGCGVYARHTIGLNMIGCKQRYGHSLLAQDATANTTGTGDSLAVSSGLVTLTDASIPFKSGHKGRFITISNTTNPANSGVFEILSVTSVSVTFRNAGAVAETSSFAWSIDDADRDTRVDRCRVELVRGNLTPSSYTTISKTSFAQPMTNDLAGIGDSFTDDGATTTLRDANATWDASVVGRYVKIARSISAANDGLYKITAATAATRYTPGTLTYDNTSGVTEATQRGTSGIGTTTWWIPGGDKVGKGAGTAALAKTGTTMTLTGAANSFTSSDVGKVLNLSGCATPANASFFVITQYVSSSQIRYENSLGVAEDFSGVWQIDGHDSAAGDLGTYGSSHAIYVFGGGRHDILVDDCSFLGIRKTCVKVSASSEPAYNIMVRNCKARECGTFFVGGADDVQRHDNIVVENNQAVDCGNGRPGWQDQVAIDILGSSGAVVRGNHVHYTHNSISYLSDLGSISDRFAISAKRYARNYSQPVENLTIAGNTITSDPRTVVFDYVLDCAVFVRDVGCLGFSGTGGTLTKSGNTMTLSAPGALQLSRDAVGKRLLLAKCAVGGNNGSFVILSVPSARTCTFTNAGGTGGGSAVGNFRIRGNRPHPSANAHLASFCRIVDNSIYAAGSYAFKLDNNVRAEMRGNTWGGTRGVNLIGGNSLPRMVENTDLGHSSNLPVYSFGAGTAWPIFYNNSSGIAAVSASESIRAPSHIGDAAGTVSDYPLLGVSGRAKPSGAIEEIVVAFGGGFADGDAIYVYNGSTLTGCVYTSGTPGAGEFNTFAELVSLIGAIANIDCADYGADFSDTPSTQHLRIRRTATSTSDGTCYVLTDTCNPNSLVVLVNGVQSSSAVCFSRGAGSAGPTADKVVVWSPMCRYAGTALLSADNAAAQTLLVSGGFLPLKDSNDDGCNKVVKVGTTAGTEEFRWHLC